MKILAYTKESWNRNEHLLECCLCGEIDRNKLLVEDIGIALGMTGENYSFCKKCWTSKDLGKKILEYFDFDCQTGIKLKDECLHIKKIS